MSPPPPPAETPDEREERLFLESLVPLCHCLPPFPNPCAGVQAGGFCDRLGWDRDPPEPEEDLP